MALPWISESQLPESYRGKARSVLGKRLQSTSDEGTLMGIFDPSRTFAHNPLPGHTREQKLNARVGTAFKPRETATDRQQKRNQQHTYRVRFEGVETNNAATEDREYYEALEFDKSFPVKSTVIDAIEYNTKEQVLKVQFHDRTVMYDGVPLTVYEQLYYAQVSGKSVNATFWNVVRVDDRRALPMPTAQADPESWADYYPKSSNFKRRGSQYQFIRDYAPSDRTRGVGRVPQMMKDWQDQSDTYADVASNIEALKRERANEQQGTTNQVVDRYGEGMREIKAPKRIRKKQDLLDSVIPNSAPKWVKNQLKFENQMMDEDDIPWSKQRPQLVELGKKLMRQFQMDQLRKSRSS